MSRTDKTAPWPVKVFYETSWIEEYHDHREGPCDLPSRPRDCKDVGLSFGRGGKRLDGESRCYWTESWSNFLNSGMARCPCWMCHGSYYGWGITSQRQERYAARRYCRIGWRDEY